MTTDIYQLKIHRDNIMYQKLQNFNRVYIMDDKLNTLQKSLDEIAANQQTHFLTKQYLT